MSTVTFTWQPDPEVYAQRMLTVDAALQDKMKPLAAASAAVALDIEQRFETETAPDGTKWDEWSEVYRPVAESYPNEGILTQSGLLRAAATSTEAVVVRGDTVFYQTAALPHYGLAHDQGLPTRKNPLPQREFLGMSDEARLLVWENFVDWFDESIDLWVTPSGKIGRRHALQGAGGFVSRASMGKQPL